MRDPIFDKLPGADELRAMCASAHRVAKLCQLLGVGESEDAHELVHGHEYGKYGGESFAAEDEPYIWDQ